MLSAEKRKSIFHRTAPAGAEHKIQNGFGNDDITPVTPMSHVQFHIGGHPVWRKDQILTLEECIGKNGKDDTQSLNTEQAMQELNCMLKSDHKRVRQRVPRSDESSGSSSSSCSDKGMMYQVDSRPRDSMSADEDDEEDEKDFNPACVQFTDDELKPTPLQRKSRKILVKAEDKDDRYWAKRKKNNMAAKRSREARRSRENQIALRASYLEKDNAVLKDELLNVKEELQAMREQLQMVQHGNMTQNE